MLTETISKTPTHPSFLSKKSKRVESIDLLRGCVMIIMALDHVRDYFHNDAFLYDPADLSKTNGFLFFTRWITHFCAPAFVFLAGISAYLYGSKKSKRELSYYLVTRGLWLIFVEIFILTLEKSFNPSYPSITLQVIWAIGLCMIILAALIYIPRSLILLISILLIAGHNLLDGVHVTGNNALAFVWSVLHQPGSFVMGGTTIIVLYPVLPWIGVMALGYYLGSLYHPTYNPEKRKKIFVILGFIFINVFLFLRYSNTYGDSSEWSFQKDVIFSWISFLNVTKYPPSLLYLLLTLAPAFVFLSLAEKPLNAFTKKIVVFGRVPFFYYIMHLLIIHLLAMIGAKILGYNWSDMILSTRVNSSPNLKGFGFDLPVVYAVWIALIIFLYPFCKWFERYKRTHQLQKPWLSYL